MASLKDWAPAPKHAESSAWKAWNRRRNAWMNDLVACVRTNIANIASNDTDIADHETRLDDIEAASTDYSSSVTVGGFTTNAANTEADYLQIGNLVHFTFFATATGAGAAAAVSVTLPVTAAKNLFHIGVGTVHYFDTSGTQHYDGQIRIDSDGNGLTFWDADSVAAGGANTAAWNGASIPVASATGDTMTFAITYLAG